MILRENERVLSEALKSQIKVMARAALDAFLSDEELGAYCNVCVAYDNHCTLTFKVDFNEVRDIRIKIGSWVQTWDGLEILL